MADIVFTCIIISICLNFTSLALVTRELVVRELKDRREPVGYDPNHFRE